MANDGESLAETDHGKWPLGVLKTMEEIIFVSSLGNCLCLGVFCSLVFTS